jgi:hypothetical protein
LGIGCIRAKLRIPTGLKDGKTGRLANGHPIFWNLDFMKVLLSRNFNRQTKLLQGPSALFRFDLE